MIIIKSTPITDTNLVSSTVPETDYAVWSAATAYIIGAYCIRNHRIFRRLIAGTTATAPELDGINWTDCGPTNRWAMFDTRNSTITSAPASVSVTCTPGRIGGLYLSGLVGDQVDISITDGAAGPVVSTKTVVLYKRDVYDWYSYWYSDFDQISVVTVTDIPPYTNGVLTVSISGSGTVQVGTILMGKLLDEGLVNYGADAGIIDYSRKETDTFAVTTFVERAFSKRFSLQLTVAKDRTLRLTDMLDSLRATPAVYIGSEDADYAMLAVLGFYRSYRTVVAYPKNNLISVEIEGLA